MMEENKQGAEQRIMDAAAKNFVYKGYSGARMQQIADDAGVNKALLHYYFQSKELLFRQVMEDAL
ncbi:MAG: helix-turn-helix transcriptional regulator, partial [Bacteroidales bacterium]|nr:helix-turn-helix transcriptional regulator [Bacteroidales bacterium]